MQTTAATPQAASRQNATALALMLLTGAAWSVIPLTIVALATAAPFTFVAVQRTTAALGTSTLLLALRRKLPPEQRGAPKLDRTAAATFLYAGLGKLEWLPYAHAVALTGPHVVVMLVETWTVSFILSMLLFSRNTGRYRPAGKLAQAAPPVTVAGAALLALSETGGRDMEFHMLGVALAAFTSLLAGSHNAAISA